MKTRYDYTTQLAVRQAFWVAHPKHEATARKRGTLSKGQNAQTCTTRAVFCAWVYCLEQLGRISPTLANRVTL